MILCSVRAAVSCIAVEGGVIMYFVGRAVGMRATTTPAVNLATLEAYSGGDAASGSQVGKQGLLAIPSEDERL